MEAKFNKRVDVGTLVRLTGRFPGHAVVTHRRTVQKGRNAGLSQYTCAPVKQGQWGKNCYAMHCIGERTFAEPTISLSKKEIENLMNGLYETKEKIEERKQERANKGYEAIVEKLPELKQGDEVLVSWSGGSSSIEVFVRTNYATGKVAIKQAWNKSGVRWIPATIVKPYKRPE